MNKTIASRIIIYAIYATEILGFFLIYSYAPARARLSLISVCATIAFTVLVITGLIWETAGFYLSRKKVKPTANVGSVDSRA
jgi:uncharacterized BrkB/YihY/UPF0761 family membrane protein